MSDISYSDKLRNLSRQYYQNQISFDEYRLQRKSVLDRIDEEFNGVKTIVPDIASQQDTSSVFMKTISFFRNKDINE